MSTSQNDAASEPSSAYADKRAPAAPPTIVDLGAVGGRYELRERLGRGGMAEVYLARRVSTQGFARDVAIKRIITERQHNESYRRMFIDEARLTARLSHRNIAQVFDLQYQEQDNAFYLVMEYVAGHSLRSLTNLCRKNGRLFTEGFTLYVISEVAAALHYAHLALDENNQPLRIVHRDVTPHNVMLSNAGDVKLLDFGIAVSVMDGRERTVTGIAKGKAAYMSPEQALAEGALDGRSDLFSLGIIFAELLMGRNIFEADSETRALLRISQMDVVEVMTTLQSLPHSLQLILGKVLTRDREERYATCEELRSAIKEYMCSVGLQYGPEDAAAEVRTMMAADTTPLQTHVHGASPLAIATVPAPTATPVPLSAASSTSSQVLASSRKDWAAAPSLVSRSRILAILFLCVFLGSSFGAFLYARAEGDSSGQQFKSNAPELPATPTLSPAERIQPDEVPPKVLEQYPRPQFPLGTSATVSTPPPKSEVSPATPPPRRRILLRDMAMETPEWPTQPSPTRRRFRASREE